VLVASSRVDVAHYFVKPDEVEAEINRLRAGRNAVIDEIHRLQESITHMGPKEAPHELGALLDVHLMLLQDQELVGGVKHWITERLYNAEWALTTQLEVIARQFDEMEDEYLRERKADLVVSDMAPNLSGIAATDTTRISLLVELAIDFARNHLQADGALVAKVFHGGGYAELADAFRANFRLVKPFKPKASRDKSSETFLVGVGLKP
jgi:phosphoenolpyruvate-protein kinase (PTS system EI component)